MVEPPPRILPSTLDDIRIWEWLTCVGIGLNRRSTDAAYHMASKGRRVLWAVSWSTVHPYY